jgi:predicted nucleotidyltransferase
MLRPCDNPLLILDLFVYDPFPFNEMVQRAVLMDLGGITVPVCAINDLIAMKQQAGRPKDLEDIKYLRGLLKKDNET